MDSREGSSQDLDGQGIRVEEKRLDPRAPESGLQGRWVLSNKVREAKGQ